MAEALPIPRNRLKPILDLLMRKALARRVGQGKGAAYYPVRVSTYMVDVTAHYAMSRAPYASLVRALQRGGSMTLQSIALALDISPAKAKTIAQAAAADGFVSFVDLEHVAPRF
jgi:hypothetical protein